MALADELNGRGLPGVVVPPHLLPAAVPEAPRRALRRRRAGGDRRRRASAPTAPASSSWTRSAALAPEDFAWREAPYEFVSDRPAIDLLTGGPDARRAIESGEGLADWIATWAEDEARFREERRDILLYPEDERGEPHRICCASTRGRSASPRSSRPPAPWACASAGWSWRRRPPSPEIWRAAAGLGTLRAVAAGGGRAVAVKPLRGEPVLGDLLREHFRGCALVLVRGEAAAPLLQLDGERWTVTVPGEAARAFATADLAEALRSPRPPWAPPLPPRPPRPPKKVKKTKQEKKRERIEKRKKLGKQGHKGPKGLKGQ